MSTQRQRDPSAGRRQERLLLRYAGMGVELAAAIVGLTLLGLWIDHRFSTEPTGVLVGAGLGIVGGFYNFIREALRLKKEQEAQARQDQAREGNDGSGRP